MGVYPSVELTISRKEPMRSLLFVWGTSGTKALALTRSGHISLSLVMYFRRCTYRNLLSLYVFIIQQKPPKFH